MNWCIAVFHPIFPPGSIHSTIWYRLTSRPQRALKILPQIRLVDKRRMTDLCRAERIETLDGKVSVDQNAGNTGIHGRLLKTLNDEHELENGKSVGEGWIQGSMQ